MRRRTFDTLMSTGGVVVTIVLLVAGAMLMVGYNFANDNVSQQLAAQKIFFPEADNEGLKDPRIGPFVGKYAGQQLTTGAQAEAYANHYIGVHIADQGEGTDYQGKTYAELGSVQSGLRAEIATAKANNDPALAALETKLADVGSTRDTIFKGETLRGLLLNAYAFWKVGQIALIAAVAAFALAGAMGLLTIAGFWHLRRVPVEQEFLAPKVSGKPVTA
jgi:hypothetical protein